MQSKRPHHRLVPLIDTPLENVTCIQLLNDQIWTGVQNCLIRIYSTPDFAIVKELPLADIVAQKTGALKKDLIIFDVIRYVKSHSNILLYYSFCVLNRL